MRLNLHARLLALPAVLVSLLGGAHAGVLQQAYLKASNTGAADWFGASVAVSGDTVVVGARREDSSATGINGNQTDNGATDAGAVYVFVHNGSAWTQQAYLKASNTGAGDQFGISVALDGDTLVVGAVNEDSNAVGVNGNQADNSLADSGAAYVFVRSGTTWTQQAYLKASNTGAGDYFGVDLSISGDTIVVSAPREDSGSAGVNGNQTDNSSTDAGAAYVFTRTGTTWTQQAYLKASNPGANDGFAVTVDASNETVVVGSWNEDSIATGVNGNQSDNTSTDSGAAYVFIRSGTTWSQQAYLKASNSEAGDEFGIVTIWGDTIVVGSLYEDSNATGVNGSQADNSANGAGAAYVFTRSGSTWTQQAYLKASNPDFFDVFGVSLALWNNTLVIGAELEDSASFGVNSTPDDNSLDAGAAYVFVRQGSTWTQDSYLKPTNTGPIDVFGEHVATADGWVIVSSLNEDSNATGVNGNQADNSAADAGATYVFVLDQAPPGLDIVLTSGVGGTILPGQSFNETRGIDVTVLDATPFAVTSMTLSELSVSQPATIGARIYDSSTTALIASAQVSVAAGSHLSVNVPLNVSLASGGSYRACFFVSAAGGGTARLFDPAPSGAGGFPYTEASNRMRINQAYSTLTDTFPAGANIYVPFITLWDSLETVSTPYCFGDGTGTSCPCANAGSAGKGCNNNAGSGGSRLSTSGTASIAADTLQLIGGGASPFGPGLYFQGSASAFPGVAFGNGLRCVGGVTPRLEIRPSAGATGGSATTVSIHAFGACAAGDVRFYQLWYRDLPNFGACTSGFNFSNAVTLTWIP